MKSLSIQQVVRACQDMGCDDLRRFIAALQQLCSIQQTKEQFLNVIGEEGTSANGAEPRLKAPPPLGSRPASSLAAVRSPMRAPMASSVRAQVHAVLAQESPLARSEVVSRVAALRKVAVTPSLEKAVGGVLENRRDPGLRRVRYGVYATNQPKIS